MQAHKLAMFSYNIEFCHSYCISSIKLAVKLVHSDRLIYYTHMSGEAQLDGLYGKPVCVASFFQVQFEVCTESMFCPLLSVFVCAHIAKVNRRVLKPCWCSSIFFSLLTSVAALRMIFLKPGYWLNFGRIQVIL